MCTKYQLHALLYSVNHYMLHKPVLKTQTITKSCLVIEITKKRRKPAGTTEEDRGKRKQSKKTGEREMFISEICLLSKLLRCLTNGYQHIFLHFLF